MKDFLFFKNKSYFFKIFFKVQISGRNYLILSDISFNVLQAAIRSAQAFGTVLKFPQNAFMLSASGSASRVRS